MIFVPGTDVHWGDPVNTSSKLGQDVAKDGEILITTPVYKAIERQAVLKQCEFAPRKFTKSRVEFTCFSVTLPSGTGSHERPQHPAMHPNNTKQNKSFKQFSIGVQCEMPGGSGSMASTRNVGHARPRGNVQDHFRADLPGILCPGQTAGPCIVRWFIWESTIKKKSMTDTFRLRISCV